MLSIFGLPFHAAYGASKGGVVQMTKSMAVAWAADGITVNVILPGWIDTDLTKKARADMTTLHDDVLRRSPIKRWGDPKDFEGVAAFLASDARYALVLEDDALFEPGFMEALRAAIALRNEETDPARQWDVLKLNRNRRRHVICIRGTH